MQEIINFPKIMGILNVTPDSFSDGGEYLNQDNALAKALEMISDGADIIDIGGESTRPGSDPVDVEEEIKRIVPIVEAIRKAEPNIKISVDTSKSKVALAAIKAGADMINDISGLTRDSKLAEVVAKFDKELVIMHIKGTPKNMQKNPTYDDVVEDVYEFLSQQIEYAKSCGVTKIFADVGIGFGKNLEHNLDLLRGHGSFKQLGVPMLLGISRKSFIGELCDIENPKDRDVETALLHSLMLGKNVEIIRVHNVKLHATLRDLYYELN